MSHVTQVKYNSILSMQNGIQITIVSNTKSISQGITANIAK